MRKITNDELMEPDHEMSEADVCKEKIIEEVRNTNNLWILQQIWETIKNIKK